VTMVDEQALAELLQRAAESIGLPDGAPERILSAARAPSPGSLEPGSPSEPADSDTADPPRSGIRALVPRNGRTRTLSVAAAVILVAGGIALSAVELRGTPARTTTSAVAATSAPAAGGSGHNASSAVGRAAVPSTAGSPQTAATGATRNSASGSGSTGSSTPSSAPALSSGSVNQSAKIEATGSVDLTIARGKLQSALTTLTAMATADGGFVASTQSQLGAPAPGSGGKGSSASPSSGTIVLQVPEPTFESMVADVQRVGHPTAVNTSATDVTSHYVDLQAQITAAEASRQQYLTIMTQASSIGDILAVQTQLDTLQSQIQQLQGQLNVLNSQTAYGTLTISLTEAGHHTTVPPIHVQTGLGKAWHDGVGGFVSGVEWLIRIAGTALFVLLALVALAFVARWAWRAGRRQML
jgi:hypothetical protein